MSISRCAPSFRRCRRPFRFLLLMRKAARSAPDGMDQAQKEAAGEQSAALLQERKCPPPSKGNGLGEMANVPESAKRQWPEEHSPDGTRPENDSRDWHG